MMPPSLRLKHDPTKQSSPLPPSLKLKEKKEEPKEEKSFLNDVVLKSIKEIPENLSGQIGLGLSQALTSPLDLMKMYIIGEGLSGLEEAEELAWKSGEPFDMEKSKANFLEAMEYLPTQQLAEEFLEKQTGVSTKPKDKFASVMRTAAEFAGFPVKGSKTPKLKTKELGKEASALRETAEEFGLRKFAGMESEKTPSITPIVSAEKEKKLAKELGETSKKAISDMPHLKLPIKKMRDSGVNLNEAYDVAYSQANKTASNMGDKNIDYSNVVDWIEKEIKKTKSSAPSLSSAEKAYIYVLNKEKKSLIPSSKPSFDLITGKKLPETLKDMNGTKALKQIKNNNSNVTSIWRKPEFAGSENAVKNAYAGINEQLVKAIEKASPELGKEISFANKIFHEGSKLDQVEGILKKSFSDGYNPKKLSTVLEGKRSRAFLERSLGKDSVKDLERIATYGKEAEKKIFDNLKNPKTVKEYLTNLTPMQVGLALGGKAHVGAPFYIAKSVLHRIQGNLFTRNSTKKDYIQFLKDTAKFGSQPKSKILANSARKLNKSIKEEFGSEEELIEMSNKED